MSPVLVIHEGDRVLINDPKQFHDRFPFFSDQITIENISATSADLLVRGQPTVLIANGKKIVLTSKGLNSTHKATISFINEQIFGANIVE